MIVIDLLPPDEARAAAAARRARRIAAAGAGAVCVSMMLGHAALEIVAAATRHETLRATTERRGLERAVATLRQLRQRQAALRRRLAVIERLEARGPGPLRLLESLAATAPADLWLTDVTLTRGRLVVSGRAAGDAAIADFVTRLRDATKLGTLDLDEAARETTTTYASRRFVIAGRFDEDAP